ncbi:ABC transporter ATP-binding protein [Sporolactobacillus terrae]|uniref:ABC transporter ATP-binding protein n=1 Tax=Sporolactobacillus terrae TaxID=269673 RepID=A0A410DAX4_9BACL|nr:ABC transporter ATP-binding protein [Sporolactobacillus terrae]QAA23236.1 ABC transporter ATP-binding protein [Sporolactobacillus terrae]QAA26206.1 ABC transporter ATP-binding protein [Sporolactobacillus terrae]UAK15303.1 ABC transporter ATP-binding protein [Sporolactobacillus terrae]BBN99641.1 dipeptide/oligopeptide/nickel ABC transporter ATP-binding protein [Sporolactobacillus terrae]
MSDPVLKVEGLKTSFFTDDGEVPAVGGIDFEVKEGEILGIVGESGCGKSVTSLSIMGLLPSPPGKIVGGHIYYQGEDISHAKESKMRKLRGNEIAMIFQEPMTSLNPVFTIGEQLEEAIKLHNQRLPKKEIENRSVELLKRVGLPRAKELLKEYPHELSGGMRQRVMIAIAMSCNPKVLIADEPTTALDVTIQAQILDLMIKLNKETNTAIIMITHDLGVVAQMCQRVVVMYAGKIVEEGPVKDIFNHPKHPYTEGLIQSIPDLHGKKERLYTIKGSVPKPGSITKGCLFAPRCEFVMDKCRVNTPELSGGEHKSRCFLHQEQGRKEVRT